jgi:hypothetical protein
MIRSTRVVLAAICAATVAFAALAAELTFDFENAAAGAPPAEWKIAATSGGSAPARWAVEQGVGPRGPSKLLSLVEPEGTGLFARVTVSNVFNIVWLPNTKAKDVDLSVAIRANKGDIDQGGGLIWRAKDPNNYYVARYNPLERNFRLYHVKDARRTQLSTAENLRIGTGEWFTMRIVQRANLIEGYLNGQKVLEVRDATFADAGGVGFWTKADAATSFDDLVIKEL